MQNKQVITCFIDEAGLKNHQICCYEMNLQLCLIYFVQNVKDGLTFGHQSEISQLFRTQESRQLLA